MLATETSEALRRVPDAIRQAYSIVVTVNENNDVHAFKLVVTEEPLFSIIKADDRARIRETAINSEAMLPGGPYDLWREGEQSRRIRDLVGAFAQYPRLPKMLRTREILETVVQGVRNGIWVAQLVRPDRTVRTFWRTGIDETAIKDPGLELLLPEAASLSELASELLQPTVFRAYGTESEISVQTVYDYFSGGQHGKHPARRIRRDAGHPAVRRGARGGGINQAVEQGTLWLTSGPASILGEQVPAGVLVPAATLRSPPERIPVAELAAESIPRCVEGRAGERAGHRFRPFA